ncbi:MAG: D-alanyl-D-alanine carboxypeptidase, partial [Ruminococcus sp.]|nr:D-alanyl-D-alanine carboxypeptidase [Ruminococcus sp.]
LRNTNKLLTFYSDCIGVKTGFTDEAGRCLVSAAELDGVTLICVTLNDPSDWSDHIKLFDYGFERVTKYPLNMDNIPKEITVVGGNKDSCALSLKDIPYCGFAEDNRSQITVKTDISGFIYAPVKKGDKVGTARYYYNCREVASADICANEDIDAVVIERKKGIYEQIIDFVKILLK